MLGEQIHMLMSELFPICRSITGNGVDQTLNIIKKQIIQTVVSHLALISALLFHELRRRLTIGNWLYSIQKVIFPKNFVIML